MGNIKHSQSYAYITSGCQEQGRAIKIDLVSLIWTFAFSSVNIQHAHNGTREILTAVK